MIPGYVMPTASAIEDLPNLIAGMLVDHRPSRMPFFNRVAGLPRAVASDPELLGQIHLVYQSAMHATRAAVYHLPHLDTLALRKRKLRILTMTGSRMVTCIITSSPGLFSALAQNVCSVMRSSESQASFATLSTPKSRIRFRS
jgi:hypothetical protein